MQQPTTKFFKMSNDIFCYGFSPRAFMVYSLLVSLAGQDDHCWPSVKTIAERCGMAENTALRAISELVNRGFIKKIKTKRLSTTGRSAQGNNRYYLLDLPPVPAAAPDIPPA